MTIAPLILGSSSPRRQQLLASAGVPVEVRVSDIDERERGDESPLETARRLAMSKAEDVAARRDANDTRPVLAADTIVVVDGQLLGKPRDRADARRMLELLSGRTHEVVTAFCVVGGGVSGMLDPQERQTTRLVARYVKTEVTFRELDPELIERYLDRAEWHDKAGAYAVQDHAACMVSRINGSYTNVVGLPLAEVLASLEELGDLSPFCDDPVG